MLGGRLSASRGMNLHGLEGLRALMGSMDLQYFTKKFFFFFFRCSESVAHKIHIKLKPKPPQTHTNVGLDFGLCCVSINRPSRSDLTPTHLGNFPTTKIPRIINSRCGSYKPKHKH